MIDALRSAIRAGMPTYAECGGLMYLTHSITDLAKKTYPLIEAIPGRSHMRAHLAMGYRQVTAIRDTLLLWQGEQIRGHEFHYSDWIEQPQKPTYAYDITPRMGENKRQEGFAAGNVLASYVHLHFGANHNLATRFVEASHTWQTEQAEEQ